MIISAGAYAGLQCPEPNPPPWRAPFLGRGSRVSVFFTPVGANSGRRQIDGPRATRLVGSEDPESATDSGCGGRQGQDRIIVGKFNMFVKQEVACAGIRLINLTILIWLKNCADG
jgi:hypothetical protein